MELRHKHIGASRSSRKQGQPPEYRLPAPRRNVLSQHFRNPFPCQKRRRQHEKNDKMTQRAVRNIKRSLPFASILKNQSAHKAGAENAVQKQQKYHSRKQQAQRTVHYSVKPVFLIHISIPFPSAFCTLS